MRKKFIPLFIFRLPYKPQILKQSSNSMHYVPEKSQVYFLRFSDLKFSKTSYYEGLYNYFTPHKLLHYSKYLSLPPQRRIS
jgi:hypothetical protein